MKKVVLFLISLFLMANAVTFAQTNSDSVMYHLPIITSLGTRYAEPWIQVPFALTYIQQKDMPRGKGYGLDEVLAGVPGVLVQSRFGNQDVRITIRGFGARGAGERSNAGTSRGVRILSNGFPDTEPDGRTSFDLTDISGAGGIEVMRSNASSIYGNASGGIVNIISNTMFSSPFVSFNEAFGSYGFRKEMVNVGANLGPESKLYFSMSNTNSDGWRYQSRSSQALLNTGILARVGERTNVGVHISATTNIFRIPGPLSQSQYDSLAQQADSLYIRRDERRNNRLGRIGITAEHSLDDNNFIAATAFVQPKVIQRSERGTFRDFNRYHVGGSASYKNLASFSPDIQNTFLTGTDEAYQDGAILFYNLTAANGRGTLRDNKREGANNFGAYVQDEMSFGERWLILVGARYDNITYHSESYIDSRLNDIRSFERVTPKAGITYRVSPTQSIYASLGGGIEVPAGNETDPAGTYGQDTVYAINPLLEPIRSTTIELGTKHILTLGGDEPFAHLTYDVAIYWLQVTNDIIPYRGGRFYFTAGQSERKGLEIGGTLQFNMGLSLNVAVTASDNKYKDYMIDSVHYALSKAGKFANYSGNKMAGIPDIFYNLGVKYKPAALRGAYLSANMQSVRKYFADDANTIRVPAYTILNTGIGIDHLNFANDKFYLNAFAGINNVTDAKYIGSAWLNPDVINNRPVFIEPGLPRNFVGSVGVGVNL